MPLTREEKVRLAAARYGKPFVNFTVQGSALRRTPPSALLQQLQARPLLNPFGLQYTSAERAAMAKHPRPALVLNRIAVSS